MVNVLLDHCWVFYVFNYQKELKLTQEINILQKIHEHDSRYKQKPVLNILSKQFRSFPMERRLSDEQLFSTKTGNH